MSAGAPSFAVIGCLTIDSVVGATGELIRNVCGGNALYAAAGVHIWDPDVGLVARVGRGYPDACLEAIGAAIDLGGIHRLPGDHPLRVAFAYREDGSRTRTIPAEAMAAIPPEFRADFLDNTRNDERYLAASPGPRDIPAAWLERTSGFHVPALLEESHRALVGAVRAAQPAAIITVDAPWYARRDGSIAANLGWLSDVDAVLPSEEDLVALWPGMPIVEAARALVDSGVRCVAVKVGACGSLVTDRTGGITHVPAYPAAVIDPTGAGDSYCGGFLVGLRDTGDPVLAAACGTVAASFVVEDRAPLPILAIGRAEAEQRLTVVEASIRAGIVDDQDWRTA